MKTPDPAYGLPEEFRLRVIATAQQLGVATAAAAHRVSAASVYNWIRWYSSGAN